MGPVRSTGRRLPELESSCRNLRVGLRCEKLVQQFFESRGFKTIDPKRFIKHIQVDGLFYKKDQGWILVEVKSQPQCEWDNFFRVSKSQSVRIKRCLIWLQSLFEEPVRAHLVIVSQDEDILMYEDFLCD